MKDIAKKTLLYFIALAVVYGSAPISIVHAADISLKSWKVTLPICDGDEAKEIKQPELDQYISSGGSEWFKKTPEGLSFYVNSNGACTTGGSENPRSELREMNADGSNEYNWQPSSGTHRMIIRQKVTELNVSGDSAGVVIGQIHDVSKSIDDYTVFRLEGKTLYAFVDGKKSKSKVIDADFPLNKEISLGFSVENNTIKFLYDRNGGAQPVSVHEVAYPGGSDGAYFKAGNYCQCGKEGRSGSTRVVITGLGVSHDGSFPDIGGSSGNNAPSSCDSSSYDETFFESNDVLFYNPCEAGTACRVSGGSLLEGANNEEKVYNFFHSKGLSPPQIAGAMGNISVESAGTYDPEIVEGGGKESDPSKVSGGWGIIQWTPGSKIIGLLKTAKITTPPNELSTQLDLVWWHMNNTSPPGVKNMIEHYQTLTSIEEATKDYMDKMEAPNAATAHLDARIAKANLIFGKYSGDASGDESSSDPTPPAAQSSSGCSNAGSGDIVGIAQAELEKGVKEDPVGCDDGNPSTKGDCGAEVNKYTDGTLEYWCADFVSWVYKQAGKPFTGGASGGWRIASVSAVRAWFEKNGTYTENGSNVTPKPGDIYTTTGDSHIGIVEKVENGKIYTISGNTGVENFSNGVGVGRAEYPIGSSDISGFGSLN